MRTLQLSLLAALAMALLPAATASAGPSSFRTGFTDFSAFQGNDLDRPAGIEHAKEARASVVRVMVDWSSIEEREPATRAEAENPGFAGYDWSFPDKVVRDLRGAGLEVLLGIGTAPVWAEGPNRPPVSDSAPRGTWLPDPAAFGAFAKALARRYDGRFSDPERIGKSLPRVTYWQGWNEPNLTNFLSPQWERRGGRFRPVSPGHYRSMLNAFYKGVKAASRRNLVVTAGTAPFGDRAPGSRRIPPAQFTRELLCVSGRKKLRAIRCKGRPARFDVLAHHPYPIGPPRRHALNRDDVVIPDLARLTRPLDVAIRAGNVFPRRRKQIWATEISWDSSPPDPRGIPDRLRARYINGAFYTLWSQGVSVMVWYLLRDEERGEGYEFGLQSGLYERADSVAEDRPKYSLQAFRFPFTAYRKGGVAELWGVAPERRGTVLVQAQSGKRWRTIARLRPNSRRMFLGRRKLRKGTKLRARQRGATSLVWPAL